MFMHIFPLCPACAEDAETRRNRECFIARYTHTHTKKNNPTLLWAQMESSEGTQSVKCSAAEHLGFFWPESSGVI